QHYEVWSSGYKLKDQSVLKIMLHAALGLFSGFPFLNLRPPPEIGEQAFQFGRSDKECLNMSFGTASVFIFAYGICAVIHLLKRTGIFWCFVHFLTVFKID
ncbi:hypothetical protein ACJX0J_035184, partial [Zea mays]